MEDTFSKVAGYSTLLKVTLPHGCFSYILNCTNDTKSRKAPRLCLSPCSSCFSNNCKICNREVHQMIIDYLF